MKTSLMLTLKWTQINFWFLYIYILIYVSILQALSEQVASKKEEVAEAIRSTQVFLHSKQANK